MPASGGYWQEDHLRYELRNCNKRYTLDPESLRVFQRSEVSPAPAGQAKAQWAIQGDWWLVELALDGGPEFQLFRWREDPDFDVDMAEQHIEVVGRLQRAIGER